MKKLHYSLIAIMFFIGTISKAQDISIVNAPVTPFNLTPEAMLSASIMNNGQPVAVEITSKLYSSDNQLLLTVKSAPFVLANGLNNSFSGSRKVAGAEYGSNPQANYLKTTHSLSSGNFKICITLQTVKTSETSAEDCFEIESDFNQYLYLVSPADRDSMDIKNPMLIWAHSEPFNVLSRGESFRMIVTEIKAKQSPEEAMNMNTPVMTKNNLTSHNLQYPYEAKGLQEGGHYAWMVQKVSNGVIVAQTDVWEFSIMKKYFAPANYASLRTTLDADYYIAENDKVYFVMEDRYAAGKWDCRIYDSGRKMYDLNEIEKEARQTDVAVVNKSKESKVKALGNNHYEIDLEEIGVGSGFHTLEIINETGELFQLKFFVEK